MPRVVDMTVSRTIDDVEIYADIDAMDISDADKIKKSITRKRNQAAQARKQGGGTSDAPKRFPNAKNKTLSDMNTIPAIKKLMEEKAERIAAVTKEIEDEFAELINEAKTEHEVMTQLDKLMQNNKAVEIMKKRLAEV